MTSILDTDKSHRYLKFYKLNSMKTNTEIIHIYLYCRRVLKDNHLLLFQTLLLGVGCNYFLRFVMTNFIFLHNLI